MDPTEERALSLNKNQIISLDPWDIYGLDSTKWNRIHRVLTRKWNREALEKTGATYAERYAATEALGCLEYLRQKFSRIKRGHVSPFLEGPTSFLLPNGKTLLCSYCSEGPSARALIASDQVALKFEEGQEDLISLYRANWERLRGYLQSKSCKAPYFPGVTAVQVSPEEIPPYLLIEKPSSYRSLQLLNERKRVLDPRHVAWILTRLYYLSCLMQSAQVINLEVALRTIFINPGSHELTLIGGWQYAEKAGIKALAAPRTTLNLCPSLAREGIPTYQHVHEMIRWVGLHLLGVEVKGAPFPDSCPERLVLWLSRPSCEVDPLEELQAWTAAKVKAFGPSQFTPWED